MEEAGVALLGTGFAGRAHAAAIWGARRIGGVLPRPVAVYSRRPGRAREFAERFGFERACRDWREAVGAPGVEVVINALPNPWHVGPTVEAARLGRHVLVEKPLGRSLGEALEVWRAVRGLGVTVGVGFNHRWLPAVQEMVRLVSRGFLGGAVYFRGAFLEDWAWSRDMGFAWRFDAGEAGYGVVGDNGSHVLELALELVGRVRRVAASSRIIVGVRPSPEGARRVTNEDLAAALLEFEDEVLGVLESARVLPGRQNYMAVEVYGRRGALMFNLERPDELWVADYGLPEGERGLRRVRVLERVHPGMRGFWAKHSFGWHSSFAVQLARFLEAVARGEEFRPGLEEGVAVNAVLDAVAESARRGGWVEVEYPF